MARRRRARRDDLAEIEQDVDASHRAQGEVGSRGAERRALERLLATRSPAPELRLDRPTFGYTLSAGGSGWGSAVYMRPSYRGRGAKRELRSVWTIPTGIVAVVLAGYFAERVLAGLSSWWPGSKLTLAFTDFGSWFTQSAFAFGQTLENWGQSAIQTLGGSVGSLGGAIGSTLGGLGGSVGGALGAGATGIALGPPGASGGPSLSTPPGGGGGGGGSGSWGWGVSAGGFGVGIGSQGGIFGLPKVTTPSWFPKEIPI